ncbi:hypothetical protein K8I61_18690, partial [bacterium]|nr:hypothetical protein [bacterium]
MSNERRNRKSNGAGRAPAPGGAIARLVELTAPGTGKLSVEVDRVRRPVGPAPASVLAQKWADWVCRRYAFSVALASLPAARKPPAAVGRLLANAGAVAADLYLALRAMVRIVLGAGLIHARDSDDLLRDELLKIAAAF